MEQFLLQDTRELIGSRISWWRQGGGYTTDIDLAEVFSRESAAGQHESRETDVPWPLSFVRSRIELAVDFQYLRIRWVPQSGDELCYVAVKCDFDGNDLIWVGANTALPDLRKASVFSLTEALAQFGNEAAFFSRQIWPKAHVDALARPVASTLKMNVNQALEGTGIELRKRATRRRGTPKCYGCGRFVTAEQVPGGFCRICR